MRVVAMRVRLCLHTWVLTVLRACTTAALLVKSLAPGGPAEASGRIQVGDILLKVDGKEVDSTETASKLILGKFNKQIKSTCERMQDFRHVVARLMYGVFETLHARL